MFLLKDLLENFDMDEFNNQNIAVKANYNSADPFPASTHPETLKLLVNSLKKSGANKIVMAERSGMGNNALLLRKDGGGILNHEVRMHQDQNLG